MEDARSLFSASSTGSSIQQFNFMDVVIQPVNTIFLKVSFILLCRQCISGITGLAYLQLIYYSCGVDGVVQLTTFYIIQSIIDYLTVNAVTGTIQFIQQKLLCEQKTAANAIFIHQFVVLLVFSIVLNVVFGAFSSQISVLLKLSDITYLQIMLRGTTFLSGMQVFSHFLVAENNIWASQSFLVIRDTVSLLVAIIAQCICSGYGIQITMSIFGYCQIISKILYLIGMFSFFTISNDATKFSISSQALKDLKLGIFKISISLWIQQLVRNLLEIVTVIAPYICILVKNTNVNDEIILYYLFQCFIQFYIGTSCTLGQILVPNYQMKKYDRLVQLQLSGFLILITINSVVNIIIYVCYSHVVTMVFYDASYNSDTGQFSIVNFESTKLSTVQFSMICNILHTVQTTTQTFSRVTHLLDVELWTFAFQLLVVAFLFMVTLLESSQDSIKLLIYEEICPSIQQCFCYLIVFIRFWKYRKSQASAEAEQQQDMLTQQKEEMHAEPVFESQDKFVSSSTLNEQQKDETINMNHIMEMKPIILPSRPHDSSVRDASSKELFPDSSVGLGMSSIGKVQSKSDLKSDELRTNANNSQEDIIK